jgi:hypothetical protein
MRSQNTLLWLHCYVLIGLPFLEDENKLPVIAPVPRDVMENRKKYEQERQQMCLALDMQRWEVSTDSDFLFLDNQLCRNGTVYVLGTVEYVVCRKY